MKFRPLLGVAGVAAGIAGALAFGCHSSGLARTADAAVVTPAGAPTAGAPGGQTQANARSLGPMPSLAPLVKQLRPTVVNIYTTQNIRLRRNGMFPGLPGQGGDDDQGGGFFGQFFGMQQPQQELKRQALGSGFSIGNGLVLTNNHVIQGADVIKVKAANGREFDAKVVGRDSATDIGVLRLEGKGATELPAARLGDSDSAEVGDYVVAIGNPFGLSLTVTSGIVSAKGRVIGEGPYDDFIQTDASINPGNSGGPLFNLRGEVIGINTAIIARGQGIGFAVPIDMVKQLLPQLESTGHVARGWLGVGIQEVTPELAKTFHIAAAKGALVSQVFPGGPAAKAGLKSGDVVTALNGKPVASPSELSRAVAAVPPGSTVKLEVLRDGKARTLEAKVTERDEQAVEQGRQGQGAEQPPESNANVGLSVAPITPDLARRLGVSQGEGLAVTQVAPNSAAEAAGVQAGDVLLELQRQPTSTVEAYRKLARTIKPGDSVLFRVRRGGSAIYLAAQAPKK